MAFIDYYKILGVDKNIPQKDIRAAYRKRAKQFHPDLHPNDQKAKAKFQALNEAYDVLSDENKRAKYDKYGEQWRNAEAFGNAGGGYSSAGGNPFEGFDFNGFGGGGGGFSSFFQDLFGGGARRGGARSAGGFGGGGFGGFQAQQPTDMNATVSIDLYTALLGGDVIITIGNGQKVKLKIKPETQNGTKVKLRGKGHSRGDGTYTDLILTYNVKLPTNLTERQKELLREMRQA